MTSLDEVRAGLNEAVGRNAAMFSLINTRLILRSGVDLKEVSPGANRDPSLVRKALDALTALGFPPEKLSPRK